MAPVSLPNPPQAGQSGHISDTAQIIAAVAQVDQDATIAAGAAAAAQADLAAHSADTTGVHGIADTSALALTGDAPTAHAASHAAAGSDPVTVAQSQVTGLTAALALTAPLANPTLTGTVTVPTPASGSETTVAASTAWAAERAMVGNLLTANQASIETDLTGWTANTADVTIQRDVAAAVHGVASIRLTSANSATVTKRVGVSDRTRFPVLPGETYTMRARIDATGGATAFVSILWYTSGGSLINNPAGTQVAAGATGVSELTAVAPATAAYADPNLYLLNTSAAGTYANFDAIGFWAGAGGEWAMPGVPITNLGTKVSHPNTDDVLVQRWDSSKATPGWQTVHYDSGWRDVAASLDTTGWTNPPTVNMLRMRRIGGTVYLTISWNQSASVPSGSGTLTVPTGFRYWSSVVDINGSFFTASGTRCGGFASTAGSNILFLSVTSQNVRQVISWPVAADAIPTSLPGTLVSAAPA